MLKFLRSLKYCGKYVANDQIDLLKFFIYNISVKDRSWKFWRKRISPNTWRTIKLIKYVKMFEVTKYCRKYVAYDQIDQVRWNVYSIRNISVKESFWFVGSLKFWRRRIIQDTKSFLDYFLSYKNSSIKHFHPSLLL